MLWRILAWIVLIGLAWWAFRDRASGRRRPVRGGQDARDARGASAGPRAIGPPERMVDCVSCGLHLPASEALMDAAGRPYCSDAHRLTGPRTRD